MRRNGPFLITGASMALAAIGFVIFALNNPQASFPWDNTITYELYIIYAIATIIFIVKGLQKSL